MTEINVTQVRKGDIIRFKSYAMRVETDPQITGVFVELRGRINIDGCPIVTKRFHTSLAVNKSNEGE